MASLPRAEKLTTEGRPVALAAARRGDRCARSPQRATAHVYRKIVAPRDEVTGKVRSACQVIAE